MAGAAGDASAVLTAAIAEVKDGVTMCSQVIERTKVEFITMMTTLNSKLDEAGQGQSVVNTAVQAQVKELRDSVANSAAAYDPATPAMIQQLHATSTMHVAETQRL